MFLTNVRADAGDRSPWGEFWFSPVPFNGNSAHVTPDMALQLAAVYACVRVLTDTVSMLPFTLYRQNADGGKTPIKNHWLYRLFARRPNDFQNPMEFREMMQGHLTLRGNAFAQIYDTPRGEVTDLIPIHPDRVTIEMLSDANWRYRIRNLDGTETILSRQQMFHIKGLSPNGIIGYNPIQLARKAVATGLAAQDYGVRFFENDARPGGWIEHPTQFKSDEQRRQWREQWQEQQSGRNKHKTAVLEYGLKYHELTVSNDDAQFIETKKLTRSEIATMFRIPPHMIGDLEKATFSNIEQQSIDFVTHALTPWLVRWEEAIRFNFMDPEDDSLNVGFPVISLLRGDSAARATYINQGVMNGTLTRNEGRLMEDRNPIAGLDEPLRPLNMVEESDAEGAEDANAGAPSTSDQPSRIGSPPDDADARLVAMASAAAERIARKEAEMVAKVVRGGADLDAALHAAYEKHAPFVCAALGVSQAAAEAYCAEQKSALRPGMAVEEFTEIARCRLERLAIKGSV
jgi:HK97 family phage portal protein